MAEKKGIPRGWESVSLGEMSHIVYGKGLPTKNLKPEGYPVFGANGVIGYYDEYLFDEPQLLISCRGANSGTINTSPPQCYITNNSLVVDFPIEQETLRKTYFYLLQAANKEGLITGSAQPQVTINNAVEVKLPLPPINEQKRIVAKIEELFSELDKGIENLKTAREQLKVYRQILLKQAFEGKLTSKWRDQNKTKEETAEELLDHIEKERGIYFEQKIKEWNYAMGKWEKNGQKGKKPQKPRKFKKISSKEKEFNDLPVLPKDWKWVLLSELAHHIVDGTHKTPKYVNSGVPFISAKDIKDFKVSFEDTRFISATEHQELIQRCLPNRGNVLVTKSGTIGRVAVVETDKDFSLFESVANVPVISPINPYFIALGSYLAISGAFGARNQKGVAVRHLHLEDLRRLPIALAPKSEQQEITKRLEERFSIIDQLETDIQNNLEKSEVLRQSILKKAFLGKLVTQDPKDEPAFVLLERIKAEKEGNKKKRNAA